MAWLYLIAAGITEIIWALGLKFAEGFTQPVPSAITIVFIIISFLLFSRAMKQIPVGTAYAVFTGIGAAGTALIGILVFGEFVSIAKVFFLLLLIGGIIGLKLADAKEAVKAGEQ
ncbi:DMT family transporter [Jeotgalibacillus proteolyticus]|uniref:Ligand-binding protein SH3 n=1 Tax=Jeotgalibacillus proteolyticus TaxID=2082395 RepID=A0A2S5GCC2_9BACL|nr:multidrug efflux SMR transporter [Jeotgalibacillus proteolyticus]PPA70561.1 ligand-binding protein SH3 [Jeotgalibacillus proteolyticus]